MATTAIQINTLAAFAMVMSPFGCFDELSDTT